jgi:hypothetical protein
MHECNAYFCVLSISSLTSWDVTILKDILRGSNRILNVLQVMVLFPGKRRRSIKQLQNLLNQVRILIVFLFLMLKLKAVMLLIKKKLRRNQKSLLRM